MMSLIFAYLLYIKHLSLHLSCSLKLISRDSLPYIRRNDNVNCDAADIRESFTALSSMRRAFRTAFVSIQRLHPYFPPAISAGIRHNLHLSVARKEKAEIKTYFIFTFLTYFKKHSALNLAFS